MYLISGRGHRWSDVRYGADDGAWGDDGAARGGGDGGADGGGAAAAVLRAEVVADRAGGVPVHLLLPRGHERGPVLRAGLRVPVRAAEPERVLLLR